MEKLFKLNFVTNIIEFIKYSHCPEYHTASHLKNREEVTPSKPISRVKKYKKEYTYRREMRTCEGRENNPAHKDTFNLMIFNLKKKNSHLDRKSFDRQGLIARRKKIVMETIFKLISKRNIF